MLITLYITLSLGALCLAASKWLDPRGVEFPYLEGNSLAGEEIPCPYHKKGEIRILVLLMRRGAQKDADTWTQYVLETFSQNPEIHYFEVPLISRVFGPASDWIDQRMKSSLPQELHKKVVPYYGPRASYRRKLSMKDPKTCYLYVVDRKGIIRHWEKGPATQEKQQRLLAEIHRLYQGR